MNDHNKNHLQEARHSFKHHVPITDWPQTLVASQHIGQNPLRAKIFKSGNSLALRLPASLGLEAGMEMSITSDGAGGYNLRPTPAADRKFNIDAIWGIGKDMGLKPIAPENRMFDDVKRPWDNPDWPGWENNA
jgi:antitoxin VapB